jgi:hypothetical protein
MDPRLDPQNGAGREVKGVRSPAVPGKRGEPHPYEG